MRRVWIPILLFLLLTLLVLLIRTRIGLLVTLQGQTVTLDAKAGPFHLRLLPRKESAKKRKESKPSAAKRRNRGFPNLTRENLQDALATLLPPLRRTLRQLGRGLRIHPLSVRLILGGQTNPPAAAQAYGYLHGLVRTLLPPLRQVLEIPDSQIEILIDFDAPHVTAYGQAGISVRLGILLVGGINMGIPFLRWLLRSRKAQETARPPYMRRTETRPIKKRGE